jgi:hypothetical protein
MKVKGFSVVKKKPERKSFFQKSNFQESLQWDSAHNRNPVHLVPVFAKREIKA